MSVTLQTVGKLNGDTINQDDIAKYDSNATITQTTLNNLDTNKANAIYESPIVPTLINSWVDYGNGYSTVGYWKDSLGYVHLKGTITGGEGATVAFILPEGYRPLYTIGMTSMNGKLATVAGSTINNNSIEIKNTGEVLIVYYNSSIGFLFLNDVSFREGV